MGSYIIQDRWIFYFKEMVGAFKLTKTSMPSGEEITLDTLEYPLEQGGENTQAIIFP
jgi:hypothetical protein